MNANELWLVFAACAAVIIVLTALLRFRKNIEEVRSGTPIKDERTKYTDGRAARFGLVTGLAFLVVLELHYVAAAELGGFPELSGGYAVIASIILLGVSYLGMRLYLNKLGEHGE
jgi:Na+/H+ antiporter NhaD/arsenite permease-like protein